MYPDLGADPEFFYIKFVNIAR